MLRLSGDTILLDDFEVATIRTDIPPSQRVKLDVILDAMGDGERHWCPDCGRVAIGAELD